MRRSCYAMLRQLALLMLPAVLVLLAPRWALHHVNLRQSPKVPISSPLEKRQATWTKCDWLTALDDVSDQNANQCQKYVKAGSRACCMMKAKNDGTIDQATYLDFAELDKYGWTYNDPIPADIPSLGDVDIDDYDYQYRGLWDAFTGLNLPRTGWNELALEHQGNRPKGTTFETATYPTTGGAYMSFLNKAAGAIVCYSSFSPSYEGSVSKRGTPQYVPPEKITPLKRQSDVLFLGLQKEFEQNLAGLKKLQHLFRYHVVGEEVLDVIRMIMDKADPDPSRDNWPGLELKDPQDPKFKAAMGSGNAKMSGFLWGQHKAEMGVAEVDQINIFNCPWDELEDDAMRDDDPGDQGEEKITTTPYWCMYLHIKQL